MIVKRYRIEELVGSGGYASVYRATDQTYGFERAIKEVLDVDPGIRKQFELEADLLINTKHPNIPHGYHLVEDRGRLYLIMEFVRGKDLEEMLNDSLVHQHAPLDERQVLLWMVDICDALMQMHSLKSPIIHRDIKPANIKITPDGRPVLIDFGLAKLHKSNRPTQTAAQGVSPGFAPPEQYMARGRTDARTDIYGMGATLYACLTGKDPPEAPARLLAQTGMAGNGGAALVMPRKLNPHISEATERLIVKALELTPTARQQTAQQLRDEMFASLNAMKGRGLSIVAPAVSPPPPAADSGVRSAVGRGGRRAPGAGMPRAGANSPVPPPESLPKLPAVVGGRAPNSGLDRPSAKHVAAQPPVAQQRTGQHPVYPGGVVGQGAAAVLSSGTTNQHPALMPSAAPSTGTMTAVATATRERDVPKAGVSQKSGMHPAVRPTGAPAANTTTASGALLRFGAEPVTGMGKFMVGFAFVEIFWGAVVLAVGFLVALSQNKPFPVQQFVIGLVIAVVVASLVGGQALARPAFRRGQLSSWKRRFRLVGLALYTIVLHLVAIWGATIFATDQSNPVLALIAFLLFGASALVVGILSLVTSLS